MNQNSFPSKRNSPERDGVHVPTSSTNTSNRAPPSYMTVGNGSMSHHAAHLQALLGQNAPLDHDSGYGGSVAGDDQGAFSSAADVAAWESAVRLERPLGNQGTTHETNRSTQDATVQQLWYNQHKGALGRSINRAIELLKGLQDMNAKRPAHYPSVQRDNLGPSRPSSKPGFRQSYSALGGFAASPSTWSAPALRRSATSLDEYQAETSRAGERRAAAEPRLVTPQIEREFSVLKLDLKLGALHKQELVHSLEKSSVASLLDGTISSSVKHLMSLRDRIEDTASKVLVTGDLNSGKSTFCNALLRRKVLPEDQQPCTAIFCEVLDAARENGGVEEVHAIFMDAVYDRNDEATYDVFSLLDLEKIVIDNSKYMQCKVYVKDVRSVDQSLLRNGVVDIALIDAPGLNSDTTKTTAIFARQEEIDVVVFVVSAANHFTQTAKEFIYTAAAEKAYLFIVVNGYDTIRDQQRCEKMILEQVQKLSLDTFKESSELVHFVSSNTIPMAPTCPGGPGGSGSGSSSGGGGDDSGDNDPLAKGKEKERIQDFANLEQSLRRFVLEKRARSKLAPAKNYLTNILSDLNVLAIVNSQVAQVELDRMGKVLDEIEPTLEEKIEAKSAMSEQIDQTIEEACKEVYDHSRATINSAIIHARSSNFDISYPGLFGAFDYADDLKEAMLRHVAEAVSVSEGLARGRTEQGVNVMKQLGIYHLGDQYKELNFRPDVMFQRKRDILAKQIHIPTEFWDFVDWPTLFHREEKTSMVLTVAGIMGTGVVGVYGNVNIVLRAAQIMGSDNLRRMFIPSLFAAAMAAGYYILTQIPHSLPHRLSHKILSQLEAIDYVHSNSARISGSVRKVLRLPADSLRLDLKRSVEELQSRRNETLRVRAESDIALKYFGNLVRLSAEQKASVEGIDLDGHPPGLIGPAGR